jgi:hypothetical protein
MGRRTPLTDWLAALVGEPSELFKKSDYEKALEELNKGYPGARIDILEKTDVLDRL